MDPSAFHAVNDRLAFVNDVDRESPRGLALAVRFVRGTHVGYKSYLCHMRNSYLDGKDNFPTTLHAAYNIIQRCEMDSSAFHAVNDRLAFVNDGARWSSVDHITYFACREKDTKPMVALTTENMLNKETEPWDVLME